MTIGLVYLGFLVLGVTYAALAGALGWFSDIGGGDIHLDATGHLDVQVVEGGGGWRGHEVQLYRTAAD